MSGHVPPDPGWSMKFRCRKCSFYDYTEQNVQAHIAIQHGQLLAQFQVSDLIKLQYVHDRTGEVVPALAYEQGVRLPAKIRRVNPPSSTVSAPPAVQSGVYHNVSAPPAVQSGVHHNVPAPPAVQSGVYSSVPVPPTVQSGVYSNVSAPPATTGVTYVKSSPFALPQPMPITHVQPVSRSQPTPQSYSQVLAPSVPQSQSGPVLVPCGVNAQGQTMWVEQAKPVTPPPPGFGPQPIQSPTAGPIPAAVRPPPPAARGSGAIRPTAPTPGVSGVNQPSASGPVPGAVGPTGPTPGVSGVNQRAGRSSQRAPNRNRGRSASRRRNLYAPTPCECDITFNNDSARSKHLQRFHKYKFQFYTCLICNCCFIYASEFVSHIGLYHTSEMDAGLLPEDHDCYRTDLSPYMGTVVGAYIQLPFCKVCGYSHPFLFQDSMGCFCRKMRAEPGSALDGYNFFPNDTIPRFREFQMGRRQPIPANFVCAGTGAYFKPPQPEEPEIQPATSAENPLPPSVGGMEVSITPPESSQTKSSPVTRPKDPNRSQMPSPSTPKHSL